MRRTLLASLLLAVSLSAAAECPAPERIAQMADEWSNIKPITGMPASIAMTDAECIQARLVAQLAGKLGQPVGYKAGLTNAAVQQRFGHDAPVRGTLLAGMLLPDGSAVSAKFGARPLMEADLLVEVADDGINAAVTPDEVMRHLSRIIPFIELPDLVVDPQTKLTGTHLVAINVGARLGVMGAAIPASPTLVEPLGAMTVHLKDQDGNEIAKGAGTAILGHPLNAVVWLARDLARVGGRLKKGDLLSLGSFNAPLPPQAGQRISVIYEGLPGKPTVSVSFQ